MPSSKINRIISEKNMHENLVFRQFNLLEQLKLNELKGEISLRVVVGEINIFQKMKVR